MTCSCPFPPNIQPGCPAHDPGGRTLPDRIAAETRVLSGATVTQYLCLDCGCHVDPDAHIPGSPGCQDAAEERRISRQE